MRSLPWPYLCFDFDYTLADSSPGIELCIQHALAACGMPPAGRRAIQATIGLSLPAAFARLLPRRPELHAALAAAFVREADRVMVEHTRLYPATLPLLAGLRRRGARVGIVTTKYRRRIEAVLAREGAEKWVQVIVGGDDVRDPKPHPEPLVRALRRLRARPEQAIYIGDSRVDAACARAAGVRFLGVATGPTPAAALRAQGAFRVRANLAGVAWCLLD